MVSRRKAHRRVSVATRDSWELLGDRAGIIKVVDLSTGETATVRIIVDAGNKQFKVKCRRCGKWGTYSLDSITDDEKNSGLCSKCFREENISNLYVLGTDLKGNLVQINVQTGQEESMFLAKSEIDNMKNLLYTGIKHKLVKCPSNPFEKAKELLFVSDDSDYGKAIQNRKIEQNIAKFRSFERWKKTYPEELIELLSWPEDQVYEDNFRLKHPTVRSPTGKKITTSFLKAMREYCNFSRTKVVQDWEGFEFSVRDLVRRWGQLDPRRYLIFKFDSEKFCYREIDALAIGSKANIVIDAKWSGGEIKKSQIILYVRFLEAIGIPISKGVFVTADDEFEHLGENIFRIPLDWFQLAKSIDEIDLFFDRLLKKRKLAAK